MRTFGIAGAVIAMLLFTAAASEAQALRFHDQGYPPDPYQSGLHTYYKTWSDLNQAQKQVVPYAGDGYRFDAAMGQMDLLERTWRDGTYDRAQLNQAIGDLAFVLRFNDIAARDRANLEHDLEQLRDIRIQSAN